jgi:outer membrane protein OmpA-like peptidoglycan-associated protein
MPLFLVLLALLQNPWDIAKGAAGKATTQKLEQQINQRLLAESRKNQCSFKTDTAVLDKGCDKKIRNLVDALVRAKKQLNSAHVQNFKFEVSGHTDSSGNAAHNKELSLKRAEVIVAELVGHGVPSQEIVAVGKGSEAPLVKPENTPAKKAKNRRYEIRVRL